MEGAAVIARRSFLAGILAAGAAPAIARAESLMRVAPARVWAPPFRLVPTDDTLAWLEALRTGQGWTRIGVDLGGPGGDITAIALRSGEIGRIYGVRYIETATDIAAAQRELSREYREHLKRQPASRSDFLGEFLDRELGLEWQDDLAPRPPRFSADSAIRKAHRW